MKAAELASRRVAILGAGREGQAAWRYLRSLHPEKPLTLVDENRPDPEFTARLTEFDRLLIGPLAEAGLEEFDVLVRSPGISPYRQSLRRARESGVEITSPSNLWFASHADQNTICITGTKGKSTTSALLAHMLDRCGLSVRLAGNIGRPLLDCDDQDVDWWVIELSSYQLADLQARPSVSLILNLSSEHLDWHGSDRAYRRDKLRLAELGADGVLIANAADSTLRASLASNEAIVWFNADSGMREKDGSLFDRDQLLLSGLPGNLPGRHNLSNAAAALTAVRAVGAEIPMALAAIPSFHALPHRMQTLGKRDGVRYINDSISSAPVATAAALEALEEEKVVLIIGGLDRGVDWTPYLSAFGADSVLAVIGIPDSGPDLLAQMKEVGVDPELGLHVARDLADAVSVAQGLAARGWVVLLSPGAPSFPHFKDYRDRGSRFAAYCGLELEAEESI